MDKLTKLVNEAVSNAEWRNRDCINLIPSENCESPLVKLLSVLDPGRYAEHRELKALGSELYYYMATDFIERVEQSVQSFFRDLLKCTEVETRPISGQMANVTVFAGKVSDINRYAKEEWARLSHVMSNALLKGGHLSSQYSGALRHFVMVDLKTGLRGMIDFPVRQDNPYQINVDKSAELVDKYHPQLVIFGKSMVLYPEPIREFVSLIGQMNNKPLIHYDAAHVLGLLGTGFQEPFEEGVDVLTASVHKTFFGTQRGIIASNMAQATSQAYLWEKIVDSIFPGETSNHHPGTLLGLLGACYEWEKFGEPYRQQTMKNAKVFAKALVDCGLHVEGDPSIDYTKTHQVLIRVDKAQGYSIARLLKENNIITNPQALIGDSSFSAASGIRTGTPEMTRYGMKEADFGTVAGFMADVILRQKNVANEVAQFRRKFVEMQYCFSGAEYLKLQERLIKSILGN